MGGCHTRAKSLDTLIERMRRATALCLEVEREDVPTEQFMGIQCLGGDVIKLPCLARRGLITQCTGLALG